jgi:hypothetical protein
MQLPNARMALIPPEKLKGYLLSMTHPVGKFKAVFFRSLGYSVARWKRLENDLRMLLRNDAIRTQKTEFGQKYEVNGVITGPTGKTAPIVTVWIILNGEDVPRFVTAYPGDEE